MDLMPLCRPSHIPLLLVSVTLLLSGCSTTSKFPNLPPAGYQVNRPIAAVHAHLLERAYGAWRKPNLTWSEDPISVVSESRERGATRVIRVKRSPPDLRLPHFVELLFTQISDGATRIVVRYNPDGLNDSTSYFADTRVWLEEIGAVPDGSATSLLEKPGYDNQQKPDSATLRGDFANFVRFVASGEAHVAVRSIDGAPVKPGTGTGKIFVSPGRHMIAIAVGAKGFAAEDVVEVELKPKRIYHFTGVTRGSGGELTLWDETDGTNQKLQSWHLTGQEEL